MLSAEAVLGFESLGLPAASKTLALIVWVALTTIWEPYALLVPVGSAPPVVYRMVAPSSAASRVTDCVEV